MDKSKKYEEQEHQETPAPERTGLEIAVIGMAGRFPGAPNIHRFWENIKNGIESISFFSKEELKEAGIDSQLLDNPNYVRAKGILEGSEYFDAPFFGYLPVEAEIMDPQVRIFHQCAWAALEDAGYVPETYNGLIGLYAGAVDNFYWQVLNLLSGRETGAGSAGEPGGLSNAKVDPFSSYLLSSRDHLASRISYKLNLKGPSMFIQTACSTSLTTVDNGCRALLTGICDMVLAGGITITYPQKTGFLHQEGMIYSSDGHCRVFDAKASGTVPAEGAGIVVLKRLEEAEADGDQIYAVIKGFAVNNDGMEKVGYTAPSITGQANVIRDALRAAMVNPENIGYIETHGTGTHLGDPVEIEALKSAFHTDKKHFCAIGSVKANLGHTNNAAGIVAFIKTTLILKHGLIPPSLHFENPNPEIDFENSPFYVNTKLKEWKCEMYPRRAGVSSFGIGGTNVHVVLEEYMQGALFEKTAPCTPAKTFDKLRERENVLILLSARTAGALEKATENLFLDFKGNPKTSLPDAAYTLQVGRKHFNHRRTAVCSTLEEVLETLAPENRFKTRTYTITTRVDKKKPAVFLFPGQGAQYVAMGLDLYRKEPLFRQQMDRCFKILNPLMGVDVKEILYPSSGDYRTNIIDQTEIAQPLIFAFEYALANLLMSWGIEPAAMVGHSIGEYTAACLAGVFSLEDALQLVALRGRLMQQMPTGAMLSVAMPEEQLKPILTDDISLAAVNSPSRCVVSGPCDAIDAFEAKIKAGGIECTRLHTSHAFHSRMMDPILEPFREKVGATRMNKPAKPYISNVSGWWVAAAEAMDPAYWVRHLRETVRFSDGVKLLLGKDDFVFIEVGPGNSLTTLVKQHEGTAVPAVVNLVRRPQEEAPDDRYLSDKIGQLWLYGISIDWPGFHRGEKRCRVSLPSYPFEGRRFHIADNLLQKALAIISGRETGAAIPAGETVVEIAGPDTFSPRPGLSVEYTAPRDLLEQALAAIWQPYFGLEKIGVHDNFFELGGDSLKGMTLVNHYNKLLGEAAPVAIIFNAPTIAELADYFAKHYPRAAARIRQGDADISDQENRYASIQPAEKKEYYALSSTQRRLYILQQMDPASTAYNMTIPLELEGRLQQEKLEETFKKLIARHESLRTSFFAPNEEVVQKVHTEVDFKVEFQCEVDEGDKIHHFIRPFDLSCAPLLRVGLLKESEEKHILVVDMHHITGDGTSVGVLAGEFMDLYAGKDLAPLRIQYKDYTLWQGSEKERERIKKQEAWWLTEFSGEIPVLHLPLDYPRPAMQSFAGSRGVFEAGPGELEALKRSAQEQGVTLYMMMLCIYSIFLYKLSGQPEAVIGTHIANRRHSDLERIMGMFVNTLALRTYPDGGKTFKEFLKEIKEKTLEAFENQEYPFEDLVEKTAVNRDLSRNPLFDVSFLLQNIEIPVMEIAGLKLKPHAYENNTAKFDLTLQAFEMKDPGNEEKLTSILEYSTRLFKPGTIERFIGYYNEILSAVIRDPGQKISGIEIISEAERRQILEDFNATAAEYPEDKTIHELFEEQASKTPDYVGLVGQVSLSYRKLNEQSGRLAGLLIEKGVLADDIVGVMMERSIDLIIGIMGILKSGAAYLPIHPDYPQERIDYMLKDSAAKTLLTAAECVFNFHHSSFIIHHSNHLAYIIYTSGSTGKPKGVMVEHRSTVNLLFAMQKEYPFTPADTYLLKTSYLFDVSVTELFGWYMGGGRLAVLEKDGEKDPYVILAWIERYGVSHINFVPSMFNVFIEHVTGEDKSRLSSLRYLILAGEALLPGYVEKFNKLGTGISLENIYGPTESTVYSSKYSLSGWNGVGSIPIGKPLANIKLYILNIYNYLQPVGVAGELCISGFGLARGYLNRPELTAEKFNRSYRSYKTYICYKTGDLGRWLDDGNIEFLGRIDRQVKIRGFRIELGEIENRLQQHKNIKEAVVILRGDGADKYLCAYIVPRTFPSPSASELRDYLSAVLPDYMVPSFFVTIDSIPLTPNGKIDRGALQVPEAGDMIVQYTAPEDMAEKKLVEIWSEVLEIEKNSISIAADFFKLGGHSLKATMLLLKIHKAFDVKVSLPEFFRNSTIRGLADYIKKSSKTGERYAWIEAVEKKESYALSSAQRRLYILQQMDPLSTAYNMTIPLELGGRLQQEKVEETFKKLIARHESLRTSFFAPNEEVVQKVHTEVDFKVEFQGEVEEGDKIHHFIRPFDLSCAPLLRVGLLKESEEKHILVVDIHHITGDGISVGVLAGEFMDLYAGKDLAPLRIQYKDYTLWQGSEKERERIKEQEAWWLTEFTGEIPALNLPLDYPRPAMQSFAGCRKVFDIGPGELEALKRSAQEQGVTLYMLLLCIYSIFLYKLSGQQEAVIGTPIANRRHSDLEPIIGMFVNTLALRTYPEGGKTFNEFLKEIKEKTLEAFENQEYPFEDLVEKAAVNRDLSRNPLFDVSFLLQNIEIPVMEIAGLKLKPYAYENNTAKFDLTLEASEMKVPGNEEKLRFTLEYSTRLFKPGTIERFIGYYNEILSAVIRDPGQKISGIEIIPVAERRQILEDFNATAAEYPEDKTIHELFEEQVEKTPDRIAVIGSTVETLRATSLQMSYRQLNEQSGRLAGLLIEKGVLVGDIVGIMTGRSPDLISGLLAILKAGAAYMPIDPDYPPDRVEYMIKDSNINLLITQQNILEKFEGPAFGVESIDLFHKNLYTSEGNKMNPAGASSPDHLAYVIYTSGSTGKPKGVAIRHRNAVNFFKGMTDRIDFSPRKIVLAVTTLSFDIFLLETLLPVTRGLRVVIADETQQKDLRALWEVIGKNGVNMLQLTPSRLKLLLSHDDIGYLNKIEDILVGGEAFPRDLFEELKEKYRGNIINVYGPTETTVWSTMKDLTGETEINIGTPIANTQVYIKDKFEGLLPIGVAGEIYIGGNGVACGYLNNPGLTAEKFNRTYKTDICYKTGDLGRWLPGGNIDFLGRIDRQVKIRGFRIELEEIESRLQQHKNIKEAVVILRGDGADKYLCAYIVPRTTASPPAAELRDYLFAALPDYMVPSFFATMDRIPLTPNGKIDRGALPDPTVEKDKTHTPPRDNVEMALVEVWAETLKVEKEKIGIDTSFFQLGGHSLNAAIMVSRIHKAFGAVISLAQIFKTPTIRLLAESIKGSQKSTFSDIEPVEKKEYYELSYNQKRLWIIRQTGPSDTSYNMVGIFSLPHYADVETVEKTLLRITEKHESFRTSFKERYGEPFQFIADNVEIPLEVMDISGLEEKEKEARRNAILETEKRTPFDLTRAPLLRVKLVKQAEDRWYFIFNMHHIIGDGWSHEILKKDFQRYYGAYRAGQEATAEILPLQYRDFAAWQNQGIRDPGLKENAYRSWLNKLEKGFTPFHLPGDFERTKSNSTAAVYRVVVGNETRDRLHGLAAGNNTTLFIVMFSVFNWLLARFSGRADILCGIISAGREHVELQDIVGFFVNSLPAKIQVDTEEEFGDFLRRVDTELRELFQYQSYPLELVLDEFKIAYPEVSVCFNMLNMPDTPAEVALENFAVGHIEDLGEAKFDLVLYAVDYKNGIILNWSYKETLFKSRTMEIIAGGYLELLNAVTSAGEEETTAKEE
ncbi:MAG: amino acid adenylation domain-containing protein [Candidatus Aminicenantes bacterium]|nr:amino acid adenylation domain-containing protein [Candidatus Aminicenantes bacterium]